MESQCHLVFPKLGIQMQSWGSPPGLRGSPWTRSSPVKSRFIQTQQADVGVGCGPGGPPHQECRLSSFGKTKWHSIRGIVSISRQINFEELPERACHNFVFSSFCLSYVYLPPQPPSRGLCAIPVVHWWPAPK